MFAWAANSHEGSMGSSEPKEGGKDGGSAMAALGLKGATEEGCAKAELSATVEEELQQRPRQQGGHEQAELAVMVKRERCPRQGQTAAAPAGRAKAVARQGLRVRGGKRSSAMVKGREELWAAEHGSGSERGGWKRDGQRRRRAAATVVSLGSEGEGCSEGGAGLDSEQERGRQGAVSGRRRQPWEKEGAGHACEEEKLEWRGCTRRKAEERSKGWSVTACRGWLRAGRREEELGV